MYFLDFAYKYNVELTRTLFRLSTQLNNTWYFQNYIFNSDTELDRNANTYSYERQILGSDNKIIAYFSAEWKRPLDIIENLRVINLTNENSLYMIKGFLDFVDYLFVRRGCKTVNFSIPEKSKYLVRLSEKMVKNYFGHRVGKKHNSMISYSGIVSDEFLYEITKEEYFEWREKNYRN